MGVSKSIPYTKLAHQRVSIAVRCRGMRVGVDAFVWLHQFAASWAHAVAAVGVKDCTGLTAGLMKRALEMLRMGMKPVFVFDGGRTPQKDATNEDRQARRAIRCDAYENGVEGAEGSAASTRNLRASVSITDEMVSAVVEALRQHGLAYYIGPLEADGQWLCKSGRFAFLFLGRSGSATQNPRPKVPVPRGAPRAPVKNGAEKRVKP